LNLYIKILSETLSWIFKVFERLKIIDIYRNKSKILNVYYLFIKNQNNFITSLCIGNDGLKILGNFQVFTVCKLHQKTKINFVDIWFYIKILVFLNFFPIIFKSTMNIYYNDLLKVPTSELDPISHQKSTSKLKIKAFFHTS